MTYEAEVTLYDVPLSTTDSDLVAVLHRARWLSPLMGATVYVLARNPLRSEPRLLATVKPSGRCTYTPDVLGEELTDILSVFPDAVDVRKMEGVR